MCTGTIYIYGKSGRAVQISSSNEVVLYGDGYGAAAFDVVACLASASVPAALRPACISLMDASRPDWYIRHRAGFLYVDPTSSPITPLLFNNDSSFIVHPHMSDPGSFTLESVNYRQHYITAQADGRLKIVARENITDPQDARFRVTDSTTPSTYPRTSVCLFCYDLLSPVTTSPK